MTDCAVASEVEAWIDALRLRVSKTDSSLLDLFDIYAGEAIFGRRYISSDLATLPAGAKILEIGAGASILSCFLGREGYKITALEPIGEGYSHLDALRSIVLKYADEMNVEVRLMRIPAEAFQEYEVYDYAFSINVMEHVSDYREVIKNVGKGLKVGGVYRFTCPNYIFPYEPHFNIPTLISKDWTERLLGRRIFANQKIPDPIGTWNSLNWIDTIRLKDFMRQVPYCELSFDRQFLSNQFARVATDKNFASRRSASVRCLLGFLVKLKLHRLLGIVPASFQPAMDCRVKKLAKESVEYGVA